MVKATPHGPARSAGGHSLGIVFQGKDEREGALGKQPVAVVGAPVDGTARTASDVSYKLADGPDVEGVVV